MSLGAETGSLTFGFLGTCVLKENGTICQLSFQYPRGKLHSEIAHPIPGGRHISAFADVLLRSGGLKLLALGTVHLTQQTRDERGVGRRFPLTFPTLSFAMTSGMEHQLLSKQQRQPVWELCIQVAL